MNYDFLHPFIIGFIAGCLFLAFTSACIEIAEYLSDKRKKKL